MKRAAAIALLCALGALFATSAPANTVRLGNLEISIEAKISPTRLPKSKPAPIALTVSGSVRSADGSHPAALKTLALEFDKHGQIDTKGLPTCTTGKLQSTLTAQARKVCGPALIGTGHAGAEIQFPEQPPFPASGPLLIFNGVPKGGKPVLIFHVHASVPAPTTFVTSGTISPDHGKFGTQTLIAIPTITGGQGSLTSFEATIPKRTWTYRGRKVSLLSATCPTGSLLAHGTFSFADGSAISGKVAKSCTPAG
jgi:hypothetical protein